MEAIERQPISPGRFNLAMYQARRPQPFRCYGCGKLLGRVLYVPGLYMDIVCPRCNKHNVADVDLNGTGVILLAEIVAGLNGNVPEEARDVLQGILLARMEDA